jgi:hypothetical protein
MIIVTYAKLHENGHSIDSSEQGNIGNRGSSLVFVVQLFIAIDVL